MLRDGEADGKQLCVDFQAQFPRAPAKIVRYPDRSLTYYRWRQSTAAHWGGRSAAAISLTSAYGLDILADVPPSARRHWLNYERRRIDLNRRLAIANYEIYRLQDWIDALETIRAIERDGVETVRLHQAQHR